MGSVKFSIATQLAITATVLVFAGAASASTPEWFVNGAASSAALAEHPNLSKPAVFTVNTSPNVTIECATTSGGGGVSLGESVLETPNLGEAEFQYAKCSVTSPSTCTLAGTGLTTTTLKLSAAIGPPVDVTFKPFSGTTFFEASLTGASCPFSSVTATGSVTGELPNGSVEELDHAMTFTSVSGGNLLSAKGKMTLSLRTVGNEWSLQA
jgi:hypothetical protein